MYEGTDLICPHGDPYCPCPDGDLCHYEGDDPMICRSCSERRRFEVI